MQWEEKKGWGKRNRRNKESHETTLDEEKEKEKKRTKSGLQRSRAVVVMSCEDGSH